MSVVRFILLAHQRSGSTLLVRALQQHPEVRMHGEILTHTRTEADRQRVFSVGGRWYRDGEDGAAFLRHVYTPQRRERAIGFKFMRYHALTEPARTAWDFIRDDRDFHVIDLRRDDLLRCLVSDEVATRTGVWAVNVGEARPPEPAPFALPVQRCREIFGDLTALCEQTDAWFGDHPRLELEYARDVEADFDGTVERMFRFLGVRPHAVVQRLEKQARRTPREQITNFDELAAAFRDTPFARFFAAQN